MTSSAASRGTTPSAWKLAMAFGAVYLIWGSTYLAIRIAIRTLPPFTMAGARFLVSGALLYAVARARGAGRPQPLEWRSAALIGTMLLLGGNGGVVWAEQKVPSGLAALLVSTLPLWMVVFDWARPGGVRPTRAVAAGLLLGFAGVALLVGPSRMGGAEPAGAAALLFSSISWAAGSIFSRSAVLPESPLLATGMEMLCGGSVLAVVGALAGELPRIHVQQISTASVLALTYLVIFGSLVAFNAYTWLLTHVPTARVATYAYVNPVVAVLLGWLFAGEAITMRTCAAAGVILTAVAITVKARPRPPASVPIESVAKAHEAACPNTPLES